MDDLPTPKQFFLMTLEEQNRLIEKLRVKREFHCAPKDQRVFTATVENKIKKQNNKPKDG